MNDYQRRRKYHRRRTTTTEAPAQNEIMNMLEADEIAEEAAMAAAAAEDAEVTHENGRNEAGSKQRLLQADPCMDKHCGAGRVCKVRRRRERFFHRPKTEFDTRIDGIERRSVPLIPNRVSNRSNYLDIRASTFGVSPSSFRLLSAPAVTAQEK